MKYIILVLAIALTILSITVVEYKHYETDRDIISYFKRAQVASESERMLEYIQKGKKALEDRGWTKGQLVYIWTSPQTDMGLLFESITDLETRVQTLNTMDKTSAAYQTGMSDCRGIVRESIDTGSDTPTHLTAGILNYKLGGLSVFYIGGWIFGIASLVSILIMCSTTDK